MNKPLFFLAYVLLFLTIYTRPQPVKTSVPIVYNDTPRLRVGDPVDTTRFDPWIIGQPIPFSIGFDTVSRPSISWSPQRGFDVWCDSLVAHRDRKGKWTIYNAEKALETMYEFQRNPDYPPAPKKSMSRVKENKL